MCRDHHFVLVEAVRLANTLRKRLQKSGSIGCGIVAGLVPVRAFRNPERKAVTAIRFPSAPAYDFHRAAIIVYESTAPFIKFRLTQALPAELLASRSRLRYRSRLADIEKLIQRYGRWICLCMAAWDANDEGKPRNRSAHLRIPTRAGHRANPGAAAAITSLPLVSVAHELVEQAHAVA